MLALAAAGALSLPYWLPHTVVRLRMWLFARINGDEGIPVPGELIDPSQFLRVYSDPAADGRSRGAALSDLFWYWLAPGPEVHQEHLEPGPRYDEVARCTRRILAMPTTTAHRLIAESVQAALPPGHGLIRLRDLVMPVWAEFYHRVVFGRPATAEARALIVANAEDVVTALKACGLRHMDRRLQLTSYLERTLDQVPHPLPTLLTSREQAYYLQGTFFNTAVVQSAEATTHLLMDLATNPPPDPAPKPDPSRTADLAAYAADPAPETDLDRRFADTLRRYPLFGMAHRVTSADIEVTADVTIPAGSVLCFSYPDYHHHGGDIPFGVPANRPCPAWRLAPLTVKALTRELLARYDFATTAAHTRPIPNRGPCLMTPKGTDVPLRTPRLAYLRARDRWEDVTRSLTQLFLGTYMVWQARRLRLCATHFEREPT